MLMTGVPAAAKRSLNTDEQRLLHQPAATYTELARVHRAQAEPLSRSRA
jgi:carbonic anhydrase/acetyltransferase-like protein (isoleucine patch superfamily)